MALVDGVLEKTVDTTNGKLQTGLARTGLGGFLRGGGLAALATFSSFTTFSRLKHKRYNRQKSVHIHDNTRRIPTADPVKL